MGKSKKEKTVGQYSYELQQKTDEKINPIDLQREIHKGNDSEDSFENQVRIAVKRGEEQLDGDFYIVVLFKKERIMHNVVRQYFFPRKSCPTPEYDQVVYKYFRKEERLEMLWVVPDKQTTHSLPLISKDLTHEQRDLIAYASAFTSGELDKLCAKLNKVP
jgi:hypothetical protein